MTRSRMIGKRPHRGHGDRLALGQGVHPGHAHKGGLAVDLGRARAALAGLAVPAAGQVGGVDGLDAVDDVEDDLALLGRQLVGLEIAAVASSPAPRRRDRCTSPRPSVRLLEQGLQLVGHRGSGSGSIVISHRRVPAPRARLALDEVDLAQLGSAAGSPPGCGRPGSPCGSAPPGPRLRDTVSMAEVGGEVPAGVVGAPAADARRWRPAPRAPRACPGPPSARRRSG